MPRVVVYLYLALAGVIFASDHPEVHRPRLPDQTTSQTVAAHQTTVRTNGRFLGWNFAHLTRQDTKKWLRERRSEADYVSG
jgi:hypothetical protein